jgi:membrane associated rhomboid family serine protease
MLSDIFNNTIFLIVITVIVSAKAFSNDEMFNKLKFNAYMVARKKEYFRMFSHGLLHAGWLHLGINMYVLWSFGQTVESIFSRTDFFGELARYGKFFYVLMYVLAIPIAALPSLFKHRNNFSYNSVGASGAVSAVVFSLILFAPLAPLRIILIPIDIPAVVLGAGYLIYSYIMSRRGDSDIAHDAHFAGAVFGFLFPIVLNPKIILHFFYSIVS